MGNIPDPNYDEGNACEACFGPGTTFGDFPTPSHIQVVFSGILACPEAVGSPNGTYLLTQTEIPCYYIAGEPFAPDAEVHFNLFWLGGYVTLVTRLTGDYIWFTSTGGPCSLEFDNELSDLACDFRNRGYGGTAKVSWGPEI